MKQTPTSLTKDFYTLLRKDFVLLLKGRDYLWALLFLSLLLVTTTSASLSLAWLEPSCGSRFYFRAL
jgi:hypothetical protein